MNYCEYLVSLSIWCLLRHWPGMMDYEQALHHHFLCHLGTRTPFQTCSIYKSKVGCGVQVDFPEFTMGSATSTQNPPLGGTTPVLWVKRCRGLWDKETSSQLGNKFTTVEIVGIKIYFTLNSQLQNSFNITLQFSNMARSTIHHFLVISFCRSFISNHSLLVCNNGHDF